MNIGFDLDDTLSDRNEYAKNVCLDYFEQENKPFKLINDDTDSILEMFDWTLADYFEFVAKKGYEYLANVPPQKDAKTVIDNLRSQGHKIYIITARKYLDPYGISEKWLAQHDIKVDKIIAFAHDKTKICKEYDIDFFVDDNIPVITDLVKHNIKGYLMKTFHKNPPQNDLPKVDSLTEFYNIIQEANNN